MNAGTFLLAMVGGGVGASIRFVLDGRIMRTVHTGYPWGTFTINVTGSLVLGFLTGLANSSVLDASWLFILGEGALGGYTTFSTAMVDIVHMLQKRTNGGPVWNGIVVLVLAVAAAVIGLLIGRAF